MWRKIKLILLLAEALLPSRLRIFLMRRRGAIIGKGVCIRPLAIFQCGEIRIGSFCQIAPFTRFKVRGTLKIGEGTKIGLFTRITGAEICMGAENIICRSVCIAGAGRKAVLRTGDRCYIGEGCSLDLSCPVTIGEEVGIGGATLIYTHGSWQSELDGFPITKGEVSIGDYAWIGAHTTIFAGVQIGDFATVGGGSVIRRKIPAWALAMGNPGKVVLSNGAHVKLVTEDEGFELCFNMARDALAHLEWMGASVRIEIGDGVLFAEVDGSKFVMRRQVMAAEPAAVLISFERMTDAVIMDLDGLGCVWFDLSRRRCAEKQGTLSDAVRAVFSDHGIRFQTTPKGCIAGAPDKRRGNKPISSSIT